MDFDIDIPLDRDGKHIGTVSLPGVEKESVSFPIVSLRNGNGPCLFINAGTHGDEFEGQIALRNVLRSLEAKDIAGQLIAIPTLNIAATRANTRCSPLDGRDLNRSFPGDPHGTASQRIAAFITKHIVPRADAVIDLHAAGVAHEFIPHVMMHRREFLQSDELFNKTRAAAQAFGMPAIFVVEEPNREGMLDTMVEQAGKPFLCVELGCGGHTTPTSIQRTERGIRNMLIHFGLTTGTVTASPAPLQAITQEGFMIAERSGLFEFMVAIGERVTQGQVLGYYHSIDLANDTRVPLLAAKAGILAARKSHSRVESGDFIAGIASEFTLKLDHLMIAARNWQKARAVYERLGFTVSPLRRNIPMGGGDGDDGGSQLIMFQGRDRSHLNYLELSTIVAEKAAPLVRRILHRGEGPAMLVNFTAELDAVQQHWASLNIRSQRFNASFPQSGTLGAGKFSILVVEPDDSPIQIDAVWTSDHDNYRVAEWQNHPNGALAWTETYCCCPDNSFKETVSFFQAAHGVTARHRTATIATFNMGQVTVHILTQAQAASDFAPLQIKMGDKPVIAGFAIQVTSLQKLEVLLLTNGVRFTRTSDSILITADQADGSFIRFIES
jgi:N2-acetyl-L-2,4-diaminobutanoate deacetylase